MLRRVAPVVQLEHLLGHHVGVRPQPMKHPDILKDRRLELSITSPAGQIGKPTHQLPPPPRLRRKHVTSPPRSTKPRLHHPPRVPGPPGQARPARQCSARQAGGWHGGKVLPPRGKTAPVTGPAGRTTQPPKGTPRQGAAGRTTQPPKGTPRQGPAGRTTQPPVNKSVSRSRVRLLRGRVRRRLDRGLPGRRRTPSPRPGSTTAPSRAGTRRPARTRSASGRCGRRRCRLRS